MSDKHQPSASLPPHGHAHDREVLKTRARALARPLASQQAAGDALDIVEFQLAKERYAVEQALVREVCPLQELTPLPCTPSFIRGLINVRGQVLPVIDIKKFFDLPDTGITDLHAVIVVHSEGVELGILADLVTGVQSVRLNEIQPSLPTLTGVRGEYLKGVVMGGLVILDAARMLADPKIVVNEDVKA